MLHFSKTCHSRKNNEIVASSVVLLDVSRNMSVRRQFLMIMMIMMKRTDVERFAVIRIVTKGTVVRLDLWLKRP